MADGNGDLLTAKDFKSDQEVRWCPGCGDYAILAALQGFMPELGIPRERIVFISGIGCAARFPYYMETYGMHSIHGRAPAIATGLSVTRPDLSVWVVTGDGDALSIGGNHLIHALRRNIDIKILLFNNQIYGLTKGQYSPTSPLGTRNKSTPMGSLDYPFNPVAVALGAEATFVARSIDTDRQHLTEILRKASKHKGAAFVEIYQNCNVYNDGAFDAVKEQKENQIRLEHGQPIRFGAENEKGVALRPPLRTILRPRLIADRKLDRGNPNPGNLGSDFDRLGMRFWPEVLALDARNAIRQARSRFSARGGTRSRTRISIRASWEARPTFCCARSIFGGRRAMLSLGCSTALLPTTSDE